MLTDDPKDTPKSIYLAYVDVWRGVPERICPCSNPPWETCDAVCKFKCGQETEESLTTKGWIKFVGGRFCHPNQPDFPQ